MSGTRLIRGLHEKTPLAAQVDFSATPRFQKGALFPWTICDYPLKQAIVDNIVKRPVKGIAQIHEAKSDIASVRYRGYLTAAVSWREYREQLAPLNKRPILFIMLNSTEDAEDVGAWLREAYPAEFAGDKTLIIHTDTKGEITKAHLEKVREAARRVDEERSLINVMALLRISLLPCPSGLKVPLQKLKLSERRIGGQEPQLFSVCSVALI